MLTHFTTCSRDLFFANRRRFAKISRKFSRLQYSFFPQSIHEWNMLPDSIVKLPPVTCMFLF
ncbi:MAG: hypothetical protein PV344_03795 [Anaplasma sp.]|nr:hypothetical protein [Anaplasma sp.]